ncbi:hypothetical protein BVY01_00490, partial [bacterium I07]
DITAAPNLAKLKNEEKWETAPIPSEFHFSHPYPNPFNTETTFLIQLAENSKINAVIYDMQGKAVHTLSNQSYDAGSYNLHWNGRNDQGQAVPSGQYVIRIISRGRSGKAIIENRKLTLIK